LDDEDEDEDLKRLKSRTGSNEQDKIEIAQTTEKQTDKRQITPMPQYQKTDSQLIRTFMKENNHIFFEIGLMMKFHNICACYSKQI
jgi:hypothetical protein